MGSTTPSYHIAAIVPARLITSNNAHMRRVCVHHRSKFLRVLNLLSGANLQKYQTLVPMKNSHLKVMCMRGN